MIEYGEREKTKEEERDKIKTVVQLLDHAVENDPSVLYRAHRAVWHAISSFDGKSPTSLSEMTDVRIKNLYRDQPSLRMHFPVFDDLYSVDPPLAEVGEYFRLASSGEEESHQVCAIGGPHGCGKTTLVRRIARAMGRLSFFSIEGCPYHEFPLHGMPYAERENLPDHIPSFDGELCTICEERLQEQYSGDWKRMPVVRRNYRLSAGFGLLRVEDSLPEAKEAGEVPESWLSVFKRANGGALFMDLSSEAQPRKFRSMIGNLVTDGTIRTQDQTEVHLDIAIVSISNTHLQEEAQLGALADRIIPVKFHLPLDVQSELKIHNPVKKQKVNNVHYIPGIREIFSRMIVVSRLEPSQSTALTLTSEDAILFYGGGAKLTDDKMSLVYHSYKELREKRPLDGAKGFTVREAGILRNKVEQYHSCIGIQHIFSMLRDPAYYRGKDTDIKSRIKDWIVLDPDKEGNYSLGKMEEWYRSYLKRDLVRAWLGFDRFGEMKERYFKDYLNHALHYTMKRKIFDPKTNEELPVDEDMLRLIENEMGVSKAIEDKFRSGVNAFFRNQGREVLADHMPLHDAIERVIMSFKANKDALSPFEEMQQAILEKTQDIQKAKKKLDFVMAELLAHGYQECCWENVRMYAKRFMFA